MQPPRILLTILAWITGALPDSLRASVGRFLVRVLVNRGTVVPTSEELAADKSVEVANQIRAAMDAVDANGNRAGWRAGKAVLDSARQPGVILFSVPAPLLVTVFMGLTGTKTPATSAAAAELLDRLKDVYTQTGHPDFLFDQCVRTATEQLKNADEHGHWMSNGILKKMFEARLDPSLGYRAREAIVLAFFEKNDEYKKFLRQNDDGSFALPNGVSYETFAQNMLANAYGPYPDFI